MGAHIIKLPHIDKELPAPGCSSSNCNSVYVTVGGRGRGNWKCYRMRTADCCLQPASCIDYKFSLTIAAKRLRNLRHCQCTGSLDVYIICAYMCVYKYMCMYMHVCVCTNKMVKAKAKGLRTKRSIACRGYILNANINFSQCVYSCVCASICVCQDTAGNRL